MTNYNSNLKNWGATGTEYPDNYSYKEGEQPVDEWDNFISYNIINDLQHLIGVTNNDLVQREGGSLLSNLGVGSFSLVGDAGSIQFDGTSIGIQAPLDALEGITVSGDIGLTGLVDGVDVAGLKTNHNTLRTDHDSLSSSFGTHETTVDAHHAKYTDSEAVSAVNSELSLTVDISGDADSVDGKHFSDITTWVNNNADVPNADYADEAGNADTVDGYDASSLTTPSSTQATNPSSGYSTIHSDNYRIKVDNDATYVDENSFSQSYFINKIKYKLEHTSSYTHDFTMDNLWIESPEHGLIKIDDGQIISDGESFTFTANVPIGHYERYEMEVTGPDTDATQIDATFTPHLVTGTNHSHNI